MNALRLFEAAGRLLSFRQAAHELKITPSAVSHGIQSLEGWLGVALFARTNRGMILTDAGNRYLPEVRKALSLVASASSKFSVSDPSRTLSLSVAPTFASRLLLPRIKKFSDLNPKIRISIDTSHLQVEFPRAGVDVAIRIGDGAWPGLTCAELMRESLVPTCSPALLASAGAERILDRAPLIHVSSLSEDWAAWASSTGRQPIVAHRKLIVDTVQMAIDAAISGLGVTLGRKPFINRELSSGKLVVLDEPEIEASTSYWLVGTKETMGRPDVQVFKNWLTEETKIIASEW